MGQPSLTLWIYLSQKLVMSLTRKADMKDKTSVAVCTFRFGRKGLLTLEFRGHPIINTLISQHPLTTKCD
jgi:hypothetical protein